MIARWQDTLSQFKFTSKHIPGIQHVLPDTLSRVLFDEGKVNIQYVQSKGTNNWKLNPRWFDVLNIQMLLKLYSVWYWVDHLQYIVYTF